MKSLPALARKTAEKIDQLYLNWRELADEAGQGFHFYYRTTSEREAIIKNDILSCIQEAVKEKDEALKKMADVLRKIPCEMPDCNCTVCALANEALSLATESRPTTEETREDMLRLLSSTDEIVALHSEFTAKYRGE